MNNKPTEVFIELSAKSEPLHGLIRKYGNTPVIEATPGSLTRAKILDQIDELLAKHTMAVRAATTAEIEKQTAK